MPITRIKTLIIKKLFYINTIYINRLKYWIKHKLIVASLEIWSEFLELYFNHNSILENIRRTRHWPNRNSSGPFYPYPVINVDTTTARANHRTMSKTWFWRQLIAYFIFNSMHSLQLHNNRSYENRSRNIYFFILCVILFLTYLIPIIIFKIKNKLFNILEIVENGKGILSIISHNRNSGT